MNKNLIEVMIVADEEGNAYIIPAQQSGEFEHDLRLSTDSRQVFNKWKPYYFNGKPRLYANPDDVGQFGAKKTTLKAIK